MLLISPTKSLCVLKGSSSLGSLQLFKFVLTIASRCSVQVYGACKADGLYMAKNPFVWSVFKTTGGVKI